MGNVGNIEDINFQYSSNALDIINLFHNTEAMVFVEGDDDVLFWSNYIKSCGYSAKVVQVNGKENLNNYINSIINDGTNIIVAIDSDYSELLNERHEHPLIMYTYGYSIENTLYCREGIKNTICKYIKGNFDSDEEINTWIKDLESKCYKLIMYDATNIRFRKSESIIGDACNRFLKTKKSYDLSEKLIEKFINSKKHFFGEDELKEIEKLMNSFGKDLYYIIKGHFITNALINFIKNKVKKNGRKSITINHDALYSILISECKTEECSCEQKVLYKEQIISAFNYLKH